MRFYIMHYRWERRVQESTLVPSIYTSNNYFRNKNFIQFDNKQILLWDKNFIKANNISEMQFDFVDRETVGF